MLRSLIKYIMALMPYSVVHSMIVSMKMSSLRIEFYILFY